MDQLAWIDDANLGYLVVTLSILTVIGIVLWLPCTIRTMVFIAAGALCEKYSYAQGALVLLVLVNEMKRWKSSEQHYKEEKRHALFMYITAATGGLIVLIWNLQSRWQVYGWSFLAILGIIAVTWSFRVTRYHASMNYIYMILLTGAVIVLIAKAAGYTDAYDVIQSVKCWNVHPKYKHDCFVAGWNEQRLWAKMAGKMMALTEQEQMERVEKTPFNWKKLEQYAGDSGFGFTMKIVDTTRWWWLDYILRFGSGIMLTTVVFGYACKTMYSTVHNMLLTARITTDAFERMAWYQRILLCHKTLWLKYSLTRGVPFLVIVCLVTYIVWDDKAIFMLSGIGFGLVAFGAAIEIHMKVAGISNIESLSTDTGRTVVARGPNPTEDTVDNIVVVPLCVLGMGWVVVNLLFSGWNGIIPFCLALAGSLMMLWSAQPDNVPRLQGHMLLLAATVCLPLFISAYGALWALQWYKNSRGERLLIAEYFVIPRCRPEVSRLNTFPMTEA